METLENDRQSALRPGSFTMTRTPERDPAGLSEELLTVLLHDLRSPLGAIGVLADVISTAIQVGHPLEPRQLSLLQEAVIKAQRILDDAVEVQSVVRGSTTLTPSLIEVQTLVRNSLEKARHAPYFRQTNVEYDGHSGNQLVMVDVEKVESVFLYILEHLSSPESASTILISHHILGGNAQTQFRIQGTRSAADNNRQPAPNSLRGRLGNRRLGESRFNLHLCAKVLDIMHGRLEHTSTPAGQLVTVHLPVGQQ